MLKHYVQKKKKKKIRIVLFKERKKSHYSCEPEC